MRVKTTGRRTDQRKEIRQHKYCTITHQPGWTWLRKDGQYIGYSSCTVDKTERDNVIIGEGGSWVGEEEHREVQYCLDHCIGQISKINW